MVSLEAKATLTGLLYHRGVPYPECPREFKKKAENASAPLSGRLFCEISLYRRQFLGRTCANSAFSDTLSTGILLMSNFFCKSLLVIRALSIAAIAGAISPSSAYAQKSDSPNEMGRIPILMYHSIGDTVTGRGASLSARLGLNVSAAKFRDQLETMYKAGWYPVNMRDVLNPRLVVPKGKTPFALTFDDARRSQFYYRKDGSIDPTCALGVLLAMHKKYGEEWPNRASFYVLPDSKYNPPPFGQKELVNKKLKFLVDQGFEIANHSTSHHSMSNMSANQLQQEMEVCYKYVKAREPRATMDTMALPYGAAPRNKSLWNVLLEGKSVSASSSYHNRCILMAWGDASYAPIDKRFDIKQVMRVGSEPGNIERWIVALKNHKGSLRPYVSDGDPNTVTVPASQAKHLDKSKLDGLQLVVVNDIPPKSAKPVKKKTEAKKKVVKPIR
jgi:peptidoglycan/xylan/chitin deacetylase (PgdA/CDA1 family)